MTRLGKVAVFHGPGEPIAIVHEPVVEPGREEALIRVTMAGICGSDVHRLRGDQPAPKNGPICFGHEVVGIIHALGDDFRMDTLGTPLKEGDGLYWMPLSPCGTCRDCRTSEPMHCKDLNWPPLAGTPNAAGFREFATLTKKCVCVRIPDQLPHENVIALGCALPTVLTGFKKLGSITPDSSIVIQGAGPVGLACTLLASLTSAQRIIVIGDPQHRLDAAVTLGASHVLPISQLSVDKRRERVRSITGDRGANLVIEAAGVPSAFSEGLDLLAVNGKFLILGLYSGSASCTIDPVQINNRNLHIIGSLGIVKDSFQATVDIAQEHGDRFRLADLITHRFRLEELEEGLNLMATGAPIKAVVYFDQEGNENGQVSAEMSS